MARIKAVLALRSPAIGFPDEELEKLVHRFPDVDFELTDFDPAGSDALEDAEIIYSYTITPQMFERAKDLRWFHSVVTGPDAYAFPALAESEAKVSSPRGVHSIPMAETVLGLMLAHARRIRHSILAQQAGRWSTTELYAEEMPAAELSGSRVLIVGLGGVGLAVAERCAAFGMEVTGAVRSERAKPGCVDRQILSSDIPASIGDYDFIVLACPLTDETRGMLGKTELASMKRSAYLINVARGELVDENALLAALVDGTIAGAACDVFSTEPLPSGHPFYSARNMIVMPHVSGFSGKFWEHAMARFAENLERFLRGEGLIGEVDFVRGY